MVAVIPTNPALALVASLFIPGLGQLIFGALGFWIWSMVDAYQYAQGCNAQHGVLS